MALARVVTAFSTTESDTRAASSLAAGLRRAGAVVVETTTGDEAIREADGADALIVSMHVDGDKAPALVRSLRARAGKLAHLPVVVLGEQPARAAAVAAGASDFVAKPAYVRDVVTLARLLTMRRPDAPGLAGELEGMHLYNVVRAVSAAERTGVLVLSRGGRRGELRFYAGEVTSAQVGTLHGLAAFHQLLLWPEAQFHLREESVIRRQQIPFSPGELFEDAERFLADFHELASGIPPTAVFEQDLKRVAECVDKIPKEIAPVVRLFDGGRTVSDVIEDSPFRVVETVKIAARLQELGAIKRVAGPRPQLGARAALVIEDWLVGQTPPLGVASVTEAGQETAPRASPEEDTVKRKRKKGAARQVDWGQLAATPSSWDSPGFAPVVPSQSVTGEIQVPADTVLHAVGSSGAVAGAERALHSVPPVTITPAPLNGKASATEPVVELVAKKETAREELTAERLEHAIAEPSAVSAVAAVAETVTEPVTEPVTETVSETVSETVTEPVTETVTEPVTVAEPQTLTTPERASAPAAVDTGDLARKMTAASPGFDDLEESFFSTDLPDAPPAESFADLDDGEPTPQGFWQRLFKKKPDPLPTAPAPGKTAPRPSQKATRPASRGPRPRKK